MSRTHISRSLRALVAEAERHCGAYYQSAVAIVGMPFEIVDPLIEGVCD